MKMTNKNKSRFLPAILLLAVVALLAIVLIPRLINQSKIAQTLSADTKATRIAQLVEAMNTNKDAESQAHKDAYKEYCQLTARPEDQRAKAVASIKEFLGDQAATVDFICSGFAGSDYTNPISEHYNAKLGGFTIDPKTNYIVSVRAEAWEGSRWGTNPDGSRWFDPQAEYDYSGRYSTPEEVRKVAEKFLIDHKDIFGVDITKMTYTFEGTKPGNFFMNWKDTKHPYTKEVEVCGNLGEGSVDATYEGAYQRTDGIWCVKRQSSHDPQVDITITTGGQIIVYRNNILDLPKL